MVAQRGICLLLVTHDFLDAVALGGHVKALIAGRLDRSWLDSRLATLRGKMAGLLPLAAAYTEQRREVERSLS